MVKYITTLPCYWPTTKQHPDADPWFMEVTDWDNDDDSDEEDDDGEITNDEYKRECIGLLRKANVQIPEYDRLQLVSHTREYYDSWKNE